MAGEGRLRNPPPTAARGGEVPGPPGRDVGVKYYLVIAKELERIRWHYRVRAACPEEALRQVLAGQLGKGEEPEPVEQTRVRFVVEEVSSLPDDECECGGEEEG